jgi:hypothetical protein
VGEGSHFPDEPCHDVIGLPGREQRAGQVAADLEPFLAAPGLGVVALRVLEQPGVVDRHSGDRREGCEHRLVVRIECGPVGLLSQVQVAVRLSTHPDRHPEQAVPLGIPPYTNPSFLIENSFSRNLTRARMCGPLKRELLRALVAGAADFRGTLQESFFVRKTGAGGARRAAWRNARSPEGHIVTHRRH